MKTRIVTTAVALMFGTALHAQTTEATEQQGGPDQPAEQDQQAAQEEPAGQGEAAEAPAEADPEDEADIGGAVGVATGAIGETFFIRAPQEFHLLVSDLPGHPVFFDTTPTGMQRPVVDEQEAAGTVEAGIRDGEEPLGTISDVVLDRRGGAAGLVIELSEEMRGGDREVAVAMGLVRMLPDTDNPAVTHILLTLDPVDVENAPTFERPGAAEDGGEAAAPQDAEPEGAAQDGEEAEAAEPQQ